MNYFYIDIIFVKCLNNNCRKGALFMNTTNVEITFTKLYTEWLEIKRISIKHSTYIKYKNIIQLHLYLFLKKLIFMI